ncbi:hypothetical protein KUTeg_008196 [Tegillarca granosa]|uniref:Uncharacterized protein n=1 Tax=Tegillarca granosa TaxID=220873 RepID=A0ABQ9FDA4_TEGGR|nr:hypothetical protein KUTeg_008196 [Tegillarca granosa]
MQTCCSNSNEIKSFAINFRLINDASGEIDLSYFSPDCFHFSAKGHFAAALSLWNNMIRWNSFTFSCITTGINTATLMTRKGIKYKELMLQKLHTTILLHTRTEDNT